MIKKGWALVLGLGVAFISTPALAEMLNLGKASTGAIIKLDTQSIQRQTGVSIGKVNFTYYLGGEKMPSTANCQSGKWMAKGRENTPQSKATRDMISIVCSAKTLTENQQEDFATVLIYDPPSNIRQTPNGKVICSISQMLVTSVYVEDQNGWYQTDSCGGGWIHQSQIRPFP